MRLPFREQDFSKLRITSPYGRRVDPISGIPGNGHRGLDIAGPPGTPIIAPDDAVVTYQRVNSGGPTQGFGYYIALKHPGDLWSLSAHLIERSHLREGASVKAGELIGKIGSTGRSTGPHLHLEIHRGSFKFISQISGRLASDDPTIDPFEVFPGLSDYVGKSSLKGYRPTVDTKNVLWLGEVISDTLNVRREPTTKDNKPIRRLKKGDVVTVYQKKGSEAFPWLKINAGEYVSNAGGKYVREQKFKSYEAEINVKALNVRKGPGTNFDRTRTLVRGTVVNVYGEIEKKDYTWKYLGDGEFIANPPGGSWIQPTKRPPRIEEGDKVRVGRGSTSIDGVPLASFVYDRVHEVEVVDHDSGAVKLTYNGGLMGWVFINNVEKL